MEEERERTMSGRLIGEKNTNSVHQAISFN